MGQQVQGTGDPADSWVFPVLAPNDRYVLQLDSGQATLAAAIWYCDATGNPIDKQGQVQVCGSGAWCVHKFPKSGNCVIVMSGARIPLHSMVPSAPISGAYQMTLRRYSFWSGDDFKFYFHKDKC